MGRRGRRQGAQAERRGARPAERGPGADRLPPAAHRPGGDRAPRLPRRDRLCDGVDPAHHPRAADGRAVLAGDRLRLQGRRPRGRPSAEVPADADDRGRHGRAGEGARDRRGRRRTAGDRHCPAARSRRLGLRRAACREGAGREPRARRSSSSASSARRPRAATRASSPRTSSAASRRSSRRGSATSTSSSRRRSSRADRRRG